MRLVHLSDIHFGGYQAKWEPNEDQRRELLRDLVGLVDDGGAIDGVLVGGDIAQSASADQYEVAATWLQDVCRVGHCPPAQVWVVPGNHDVDRASHASAPLRRYLLQVARSALLEQNYDGLDQILHDWFMKDEVAQRLFESTSTYNDFADKFGCAISPTRWWWTDQTLDLDGLVVQLIGLNSMLVSDTSDISTKPSLALGRRQCELDRIPGGINIAFAHHPPEWIGDWGAVEPYLLSRTHLLLFGHEHRYDASQPRVHGTVIVRAGAVGPEVGGGDDYVPSWNLITLTRADPMVEIRIQPRVWSREHTCFVEHGDGVRSMCVRIDLRPAAGDPPAPEDDQVAADAEQVKSATPLLPELSAADTGDSGLIPPDERVRARDLTVRFLNRPKNIQRRIASELGVDEDFDTIDRRLRGTEMLKRIRDRNLINELKEKLGDA